MSPDTIISIVSTVLTTVVAIYAILDSRRLVKNNLQIQRNLAYRKLNNDLVWTVVEPVQDVYPSEIVKAFYDFDLLARELKPKWNPKPLKEAVENEALQSAHDMVQTGKFIWKKDVDVEEVKKMLDRWNADKNKVKVARLLRETEL